MHRMQIHDMKKRAAFRRTVGAAALAVLAASAGGGHLSAQNLVGDTTTIDLVTGGSQSLLLQAPGFAGEFYFLAGTSEGTSPGFDFGGFHIPLNPFGGYWTATILLGAPELNNSFGQLNSGGLALADFTLPSIPDLSLVGITVSHAYVILTMGMPLNLQGVSNAVNVTFIINAPTVVSVTPSSGTSLGGTSVTISGTGFQAGAPGPNTVTFGGVDATNVVLVDDTTLTCDAPAGPPGASVDVQVTNLYGTGTLPAGYAYHPLPTLTAVSPASGTSLGGTSVTLTGTGFLNNAAGTNTVTFGVGSATIVAVSDTSITCDTPAGTASATVDVVVTNVNGSATLVGGYTYDP